MIQVLLVVITIYATLATIAVFGAMKEIARIKSNEATGYLKAMQWALDTYKKFGDNPILWKREFRYELVRGKYHYGFEVRNQDVGSSEFP